MPPPLSSSRGVQEPGVEGYNFGTLAVPRKVEVFKGCIICDTLRPQLQAIQKICKYINYVYIYTYIHTFIHTYICVFNDI